MSHPKREKGMLIGRYRFVAPVDPTAYRTTLRNDVPPALSARELALLTEALETIPPSRTPASTVATIEEMRRGRLKQ